MNQKKIVLLLCIVMLSLGGCKKEAVVLERKSRTIVRWVDPRCFRSYEDRIHYTADIKIAEVNEHTNMQVFLHDSEVMSDYVLLPYVLNTATYSYEQWDGGITLTIRDPGLVIAKPEYPILMKLVIFQ
jgi:hypothetical protein